MQITFTCVKCDTRSSHEMSKLSYTTGVVLIRCPGCKNNHLIADHLGWFEDDGTTIEDIIKAKGGSFQKISDGDFESDPQLVYDHIQALAASSSAEAGEGESESESEARPEK